MPYCQEEQQLEAVMFLIKPPRRTTSDGSGRARARRRFRTEVTRRLAPFRCDCRPQVVEGSITKLLLCAFFTLWATSDVLAQRGNRDPHLAYAFPAGCQRGLSCEIVIGGQHLKEVTEAYIAGQGVTVEVLGWYRPMSRGVYNDLRMKMQEAREKLIEERQEKGISGRPSEAEVALAAGISHEQLQEMEIYRQRERDPKRQPNEQLEEELTLKVTVAHHAALGKRELRLLTEGAISNPLWLHIGQWPELYESEPNDREPNIAVGPLPLVINGQIMPGDVDRFTFEAREGTKLVVNVAARDVIPYLADAVPGWFQAVLRLTDSSGNEVSFADSYHYRQDPVLYFEVPRDDRYTIEIRDSLYRGREDFVYRVSFGEIPFVTNVFPMGARVDSELTVELTGWNLTHTRLDVQTMSRRQYRPQRWYSADQGSGNEVRFPLQIDHWPEVIDQEPNNDRATAQPITTRMTVNGRIDQPGDEDVYRIDGGGRLVAEIHARRLGSPLDSMLTLTDASGKELAFNDDHEDMSQGLTTHHADSLLTASLPAGGEYYLRVSDAQNGGGNDFSYRLCLRAPQPDYELRVVPSSVIARAGQIVPITVFALREDGFDQDIELRLVDPPSGYRLDGAVIPGDADQVQLTLAVPEAAADVPIELEMEGSAPRRTRSRSLISKPAIPAENMMQAFIWYHLVPVERWNVVVSGKRGPRLPFQFAMPNRRVLLPRGSQWQLPIMMTSKQVEADQLQAQLSNPPDGITADIISNEQGAMAIEISSEADVVQPGLRGNLLISVYREYTPEPTESNPAPRSRRTDYGYLPAIPFEVSKRKSAH